MNHEPDQSAASSGSIPASNLERLRWRPWPCEACSRGFTAIGYLLRRAETGRGVWSEEFPEDVASEQVAFLQEWVSGCPHQPEQVFDLPRLAEGSEHIVYLSAGDAMVLKLTKLNLFGESYYLKAGRIVQRNSSPLEYLLRLRLWRKLFGSAPADCGITQAGQIVSIHQYITGTLPAQENVDDFLEQSGLVAVRRNFWLWKRSYDDFDVWVGDARDENFVSTVKGIVPIDLRCWATETQQQ